MGSPRSPATTSTLDQTHSSSNTHQHRKRKSTAKSFSHDEFHSDSSSTAAIKKKKKKKRSRKERHQDDLDHEDTVDIEEEEGQDESKDHLLQHNGRNGHGATSPSSQPAQKLPKIKISLRLPSNPAIIPSSASSSTPTTSTHKRSNSSSSLSKKKRRSSEHISIISEDDEEQEDEAYIGRRQTQSSIHTDDLDNERPSSIHKKKKKHKHKHKHHHLKHQHNEYEIENADEEGPMSHNIFSRSHEGSREYDLEAESESGTPKITLRLGKDKKESKRNRKVSTIQDAQYNSPADEAGLLQYGGQRKNSIVPKARSRSRSLSQSVAQSPVVVKQEETYQTLSFPDSNGAHAQVGQKRPFLSLMNERSGSYDTEAQDQMTEDMDEDLEDPLAGDLDEPEDDDEEEGDNEDEDNDGQQNERDDQSDNEGLMSPMIDPGMHAHFSSKSVKGGQKSSKTIPGSGAEGKHTKPRTPKATSEEPSREGSTSAAATPKSRRKGKHVKRPSTSKITTPAAPKKKELSVICHKLLDSFIKKDMYVLFTEPVDPVLVPDYSSIIKNPMDFSTMRAKVERNFYPNIDEFLKDFQLVCDNARLYNAKETLYWRQADKLWEWGSKAIERERKSVLDKDDEAFLAVKGEENVDVGGMGDYSNTSTGSFSQSRRTNRSQDLPADSPMSFGEAGRIPTPQQYRKSKKIKHRRDGTIALSYATDGSIDPASHPDPWSLVPVEQDFGSAPLVCPLIETNPNYNGLYLDDYPYWKAPKSQFRPAAFLDYGPFAVLGRPATDNGPSGVKNIPAYTGMVFGDEKGEAYVRSLAMFLDGIVDQKELAAMSKEDAAGLFEVQDFVRQKVETLTRGASTFVDKVATIVKEEKTGQHSDVDTRVPLKLWRQDFNIEAEEMTSTRAAKTDVKEETQVESKGVENNIKGEPKITSDQAPNNPPEESKEIQMGESKVLQGLKDEKTNDLAKSEMEDEIMKDTEEAVSIGETKASRVSNGHTSQSMQKGTEKDASTASMKEWIDIRQVVKDIQAWPKLLRAKTEYEAWRTLKIELDSLLPPAQRSIASTADDDVEIKWGQTWSGGDSEENKKWVREYLEQNSIEMRQVVQLMVSKTLSMKNETSLASSSTPTPISTSVSGGVTPSSTPAPSPVASTPGSEEQEKLLLERLIKSIRKRLAEMAQYVPLSEVNPQRLPPPVVPASTNAPTTATTPSSASASTSATPPVVANSATAAAATPVSTLASTPPNITSSTQAAASTPAMIVAPTSLSDSTPAIASATNSTATSTQPHVTDSARSAASVGPVSQSAATKASEE
ncbi:hypothetical protein BX616_000049 [Lobosporangium transversale]|nr:hypothetical protein BX616_000049 [Lobosporangium transversale]